MTSTADTDLRTEEEKDRATLVLVFSILSAGLSAGYGVLFTMGGDYRESYGVSETQFGVIIGVGFITAFLAQFTLGPLGDRGHARLMVLGGALVNAAGLLMMGFGTTFAVLIAGRVLSGLAIGAANPAIKRIIVVGSGADVGRNLGRLFSADVFGFAMGPVISAALVGPFGIAAPFLVIAAATVVAVTLSLRVRVAEVHDPEPQRFAFDLLRRREFAGAVMIGVAVFVMIGTFDTVWDLVHTDLGTAEWMANLGIALFAIPLVILGPTSGRLAQRIGPFVVSIAGMVAATMFFGLYGLATTGVMIFAIAMAHAITDGLSIAATGVAVALTVPETRQAGAHGVLGGMQALGAGLMAPAMGWLYENHGQRAVYWCAAAIMAALTLGGYGLARPAVRLKG